MDAEPLLPAHLEDLRLENQRPRSIRERRLTVMRTNRKLGKPVAEATRDDLKQWQAGIAHLTPAGQHNEIVHTVQYLKWIISREYRLDDPTVIIIRPKKVHQSLPRPMSDEDVGRALLTAPYPERAWIALGAFCGLRCMEIAKLTRKDIRDDHDPAMLEILDGKGGKSRTVPLPAPVLEELNAASMPTRGYLWARMDGQAGPPSAMRVSERINAHLHAQGIRGTAHALRHRFGTILYRETRDIQLVADMMGHSTLDTTRMYVKANSPFDAAAAVEAISRLGATANQLRKVEVQP
jgi:integrase